MLHVIFDVHEILRSFNIKENIYYSYKQVHLQTLNLKLYLIPLLGYSQQYREDHCGIRKKHFSTCKLCGREFITGQKNELT